MQRREATTLSFQSRRRTASDSRESGPLGPEALYSALLRAQTRREHSRAELRAKFERRAEVADLDAALDRLQADGYQSDARFVEVFVRSRIGRGQGPRRIEQELRQRGCSEVLLEEAIAASQPDWEALAAAALERRFGEELADDDRPRAGRFLASRGFPSDIIYRLVRFH